MFSLERVSDSRISQISPDFDGVTPISPRQAFVEAFVAGRLNVDAFDLSAMSRVLTKTRRSIKIKKKVRKLGSFLSFFPQGGSVLSRKSHGRNPYDGCDCFHRTGETYKNNRRKTVDHSGRQSR